MALNRKLLKIFADSASNNGQFGSYQATTKVISNDPDVIQALSAWNNGWLSATTSATKLPRLEEMQGLQYVFSYMIKYIYQLGIAEWLSTETYPINSFCQYNGVIYKSLQNDNTNQNPSTATAYWTSEFIPQATELLKGIMAIATQTETDNGITDAEAVSPLKLKNSKWIRSKLLNQFSVNNVATIELTSFVDSFYDAYEVEIYNLIPVTDGTRLQCRVSEDNGSTWKSGASDYDFVTDGRDSSGTIIGNNSTSSSYMEFNAAAVGSRISNSSDAGYYGRFIFENMSGTTNKKIMHGEVVYTSNATPYTSRMDVGGVYKGTTNVIDGIQFFMDSGNISSAIIKLTGLKA